MATVEVRQAALKRYLDEIKQKNAGSQALEENTDTKMLHMNAPLGGWKEWSTLTYDHNVLGDLLLTENEQLKKIKEEVENMIKVLSPPAPGAFPWSVPQSFPTLNFPMPQSRSAKVKVEEEGTGLVEKS
ncbi:uncharacterized protein LOC116186991 isoform X2 [Punica granatum]|nr:uncharacterized protein LOC116186991 isoform X2 [Punica granatum]PKI51003.1 hypothetical protein CRG98_028600 [Punica granatum]